MEPMLLGGWQRSCPLVSVRATIRRISDAVQETARPHPEICLSINQFGHVAAPNPRRSSEKSARRKGVYEEAKAIPLTTTGDIQHS